MKTIKLSKSRYNLIWGKVASTTKSCTMWGKIYDIFRDGILMQWVGEDENGVQEWVAVESK